MSNKNDQKKTRAKRLGIKSVLTHGNNRLAITTFGKGNDAEIALQTDAKGNEIKDKLPQKVGGGNVHTIVPDIDVKGKDYQGNSLEVLLNNPAEHVGEDYLKLKSQLEKEFFGNEFSNDNIHIQIIHNILDIQKILGLYVNDIIYVIDNLQGDIQEESKLVNILGERLSKDKVKELLKKINDYLSLFGETFNLPKSKKDEKVPKEQQQEHGIGVLRLLGAVRLCTAHFKNSHFLFAPLDGIEKKLKKEFKDEYKSDFTTEWSIIEQNYANMIDRINKDFIKNSVLNLYIIYSILKPKNTEEKRAIIKDYYEFIILKVGKNLGINMKKLRELIFKDFFHEVKVKNHDSYRQKINIITDFFLFRQYRKTATIDKWVTELRGTENNKVKEECYKKFAKEAAMMLGSTSTSGKVRKLIEVLSDYFGNKNQRAEIPPLDVELTADILLKVDATTPLTKLIAFLCNFWEGKEINELLSAYIHKFANIQTFINILDKLEEEEKKEQEKKVKVTFTEKYALFNEANNKYAGQIANELRILASIGKMKPDLEGAKRQLYKAAIETLGVPDDSDKLSNEWIEKNLLLSAEEKKNKARKEEVNPFRNFIANNVIESRRFMYLVRYTKPKTARALMQNRKIVHYVLSRIGDIQDVHVHGSQIDKYYLNLPNANEKENDKNRKIDALADYLVKFSFDTLLKNKKGIIANTKCLPAEKNIEIEHLKALTGLYLTVAYIAVKNIVKTNARYYIAFSAFDRDCHLFENKLKNDEMFQPKIKDKTGKDRDNYFALTQYFLDKDDETDIDHVFKLKDGEKFGKAFRKFLKTVKHHFDKKWRGILQENISEAKAIHETGLLLTLARNNVEHLNVLTELPKYVGDFRKNDKQPMTSYFELFQYVLQRMMTEPDYLNEMPKLQQFAETLQKYHAPNNDLIKLMFVSLAYNLPRYKNLTIEALFDEDSESGKKLVEERKQEEDKKKNNKQNN